jgi:hypothetical protein
MLNGIGQIVKTLGAILTRAVRAIGTNPHHANADTWDGFVQTQQETSTYSAPTKTWFASVNLLRGGWLTIGSAVVQSDDATKS